MCFGNGRQNAEATILLVAQYIRSVKNFGLPNPQGSLDLKEWKYMQTNIFQFPNITKF